MVVQTVIPYTAFYQAARSNVIVSVVTTCTGIADPSYRWDIQCVIIGVFCEMFIIHEGFVRQKV